MGHRPQRRRVKKKRKDERVGKPVLSEGVERLYLAHRGGGSRTPRTIEDERSELAGVVGSPQVQPLLQQLHVATLVASFHFVILLWWGSSRAWRGACLFR
jgi:hypothetical protein